MCRLLLLWSIINVLVGAAIVPCSMAQETPAQVVQAYVGELIQGDWEAAKEYWHDDDLRRAHRLGIDFIGTPLKIDCASPLIPAIGGIRSARTTLAYGDVELSGDLAVVPVYLRTRDETVESRYHLLRTADGWRLISPITARTREWVSRETRFLRVCYSDSSLINEVALAEADRFVADLCARWQMYDEDVRHLENLKLEYYLGDVDDMEAIAGFDVHGMTSFPLDAILTRHMPHHHELVHALVNYRLRRPPLHTLPLVQEGLAVALGGRWEKSADVLLQFGAFMLATEFVRLDEVLTNDDFSNGMGSLDISYAAGGVLAAYLIDKYGFSQFFRLYEALSTPDAEYSTWTAEVIKGRFERVYQVDWAAIEAGVLAYAAQHRNGRLCPGGNDGGELPLQALEAGNLAVRVWESADEYVFSITGMSADAECVLTLTDETAPTHRQHRSRLFAKHLPSAEYAHQRYGIQVTNAEAGLYDYYTDHLIEKYVLSFDPSEAYWDAESQVIRFRLAKDALPRPLADYRVDVLIP